MFLVTSSETRILAYLHHSTRRASIPPFSYNGTLFHAGTGQATASLPLRFNDGLLATTYQATFRL